MCGIVGYVGQHNASEIIVDGLRRLEYRGYDSAGLVVLDGGRLTIHRRPGKIADLAALLEREPATGGIGLGHTRWATHGAPSESNSHPHADCSGSLAVVHNGIIENYLSLKQRLLQAGHVFRSQTDTEVIAHLLEQHLAAGRDLVEAVRCTLRELRGAYALGVISTAAPDRLIVAKHGAGSVIVGIGQTGTFVASDIPALLPHTREMIILEDGDVAVLSGQGVALSTVDAQPVERPKSRITWDAACAQKGGYPHFMLKEIHEQPQAVTDTLRGRVVVEAGSVDLPEAGLTPAQFADVQRVWIVACGTSWHAALVGKYLIEEMVKAPVQVDIGSEFRYRNPLVQPGDLFVSISQSGETADTLAAAREAKRQGARVI